MLLYLLKKSCPVVVLNNFYQLSNLRTLCKSTINQKNCRNRLQEIIFPEWFYKERLPRRAILRVFYPQNMQVISTPKPHHTVSCRSDDNVMRSYLLLQKINRSLIRVIICRFHIRQQRLFAPISIRTSKCLMRNTSAEV